MGRKKVLLLAAVLFTVSALGAALPSSCHAIRGRPDLGRPGDRHGVDGLAAVHRRGGAGPNPRPHGSLNQLAIVSGMVVVYYVNSLIANLGDNAWNVSVGWRWMFASGTLPAVLFFVLLFLVPESPRWLTERGREARPWPCWSGSAAGKRPRWKWRKSASCWPRRAALSPNSSRRGCGPLIIALALAVLQQITGINVVLYYAPEIFKTAGVKATQAIGDTVTVGVVNMLFTLVAIWMVDKLGASRSC